MTDLERLELILRRVWAKNDAAHRHRCAPINLDTQELLQQVADEIAMSLSERRP